MTVDLIISFLKIHWFVLALIGVLILDIVSYLVARSMQRDGGPTATIKFLKRRIFVILCAVVVVPFGLFVGDVFLVGQAIDGAAGLTGFYFLSSLRENAKDMSMPFPHSVIKKLEVIEDRMGNGRTLIQREEAELIAAKAMRLARTAQTQAKIMLELAHTDDERHAAQVGITRAAEDTENAKAILTEARHQTDIHEISTADIEARTDNEPLFVDDDITPDTKPTPVVIVTNADDTPLPVVVKNEG